MRWIVVCLLLLFGSFSVSAQDTPDTALDRALDLNRQMESGLLGLKLKIEGLNESLATQTLDLSEATANLDLLLNDYLRLESLYEDLQQNTKEQLSTLTVSLTYAENRQKFWKRFAAWSIPIAFVLGIAGGSLATSLLSH